jgi:hypothetical protein
MMMIPGCRIEKPSPRTTSKLEYAASHWKYDMKQFFTKQNLPMILLLGMIAWAWLSLVSVLIASLF